MLTPVPLPAANIPVHDPQTGLMALPWRKFFEYQQALADQQVAQTQAAAQQAAAAQMQANAASAQASSAQSSSSGGSSGGGSTPQPQSMSASGTSTLNGDPWVMGAAVTFTNAVAASSVDVGGSGPTAATGRTTNARVSGQARLIRTEGGADTVVAGPVAYTWSYDADAKASSMEFAGFPNLGADSTTGTISYRVDVNGTAGAMVQTMINVTRNP